MEVDIKQIFIINFKVKVNSFFSSAYVLKISLRAIFPSVFGSKPVPSTLCFIDSPLIDSPLIKFCPFDFVIFFRIAIDIIFFTFKEEVIQFDIK